MGNYFNINDTSFFKMGYDIFKETIKELGNQGADLEDDAWKIDGCLPPMQIKNFNNLLVAIEKDIITYMDNNKSNNGKLDEFFNFQDNYDFAKTDKFTNYTSEFLQIFTSTYTFIPVNIVKTLTDMGIIECHSASLKNTGRTNSFDIVPGKEVIVSIK